MCLIFSPSCIDKLERKVCSSPQTFSTFLRSSKWGCGRASRLPAIYEEFENLSAKSIGILVAADRDKLS